MKQLFVYFTLSALALCASWSRAQSGDRVQEVVAQMNLDTKGAVLIPSFGLGLAAVEGESVNLGGDKITLVVHYRNCLVPEADEDDDTQCVAEERELPLIDVDFDSIKPAVPSADEKDFHYIKYRCKRGSSCAEKEPWLLCRDARACKRMAEALRELVAGFQFAKGMADVLSSFQGPSKSGERETAPTADIAPPGMFPAFGTKARAAMEQDGTLLVHWGDVFHPDATVYKYPPSHPLYARIKQDVDYRGDVEAPRRPIKPGETRGFTPTMTEAK
jgi:hypothetical protein